VKEYYEKDEEETEEGTNIENQDNEKEEGFSINPVRNAEVQIIKNPDILLIEGITNRKGIMNYEIGKDDNNLSIIVTKFGYFPSQRTFNRNEDIKVNENGKYEMNMSLILIKQSLLSKNHKVLLVSYANTYKQLFDFICINEDEKNNKITPLDLQNKEGTFICSFSCIKKDNEAESEEQNEEKIEKEEKKENEEDEEDQPKVPQNASNEEFNEDTFYEEIIRVGFNISSKSIQTNPEEENKENNENLKEMTVLDII
jgi:septum formation inhibitor MinC